MHRPNSNLTSNHSTTHIVKRQRTKSIGLTRTLQIKRRSCSLYKEKSTSFVMVLALVAGLAELKAVTPYLLLMVV